LHNRCFVSGCNWAGWKVAQSVLRVGLQLGGGGAPSRSGIVLSSGVNRVNRALKGGLPPNA
jgi:hypothetical protein